jgi:hypothetical protein
MDTNKELLIHNANQYAKKRNVDTSTLDWESLLDKELSDGENWGIIKEEVRKRMDKEDRLEAEAEELTPEEIRAKEREIEERYIEQIENQQKEELEDFVQTEQEKNTEEVQQFYRFFNHYARAVANDHHDALMVKADPGIGKSYQLRNIVLPEELGTEGFTFHSGYCPPFQFYKKLHEVENDPEKEVLVLDDIEGLINNKKALAILKQATWSETDERYVEWNSSQSKLKTNDGEDLPSKFKFTGRLIMVFNEVDHEDPIVNSLIDRCFYYELEFTYEQRVKLCMAVAKKGTQEHDIPEDKRIEIASWLKDVTSPATKDFNLRTLMTAFNIYEYNNDIGMEVGSEDWESLTEHLIEADSDLLEVRDIIVNGDYGSVSDRKKEFKERTGKSGRTYNRKRDELLEKSEVVQKVLNEG